MRPLATALVASILAAAPAGAAEQGFSPYVGETGRIQRPTDYRSRWAHLGSWIVPEAKAPGHGFHDVYTQPETVAQYRATGRFPDGAVLVKEIRAVESAELTTGRASWAGEPITWFVMIKDAKGRFPGNPNWGEGWGWALYKADAPERNVSSDYRADCLPCHRPAQGQDWVYLRGYPMLKE